MILVDTSVWIDFFRGEDTPYRKTLHALIEQEEDVCLSGIILTEILQGIRDDKASSEVQKYLLGFSLSDPQGISSYINAANIFKACAKKGKAVRRTIDCLIAAIAIENNLVLLHNDRDFASIAACTDLQVLAVP